jgi:hypothetical protein
MTGPVASQGNNSVGQRTDGPLFSFYTFLYFLIFPFSLFPYFPFFFEMILRSAHLMTNQNCERKTLIILRLCKLQRQHHLQENSG